MIIDPNDYDFSKLPDDSDPALDAARELKELYDTVLIICTSHDEETGETTNTVKYANIGAVMEWLETQRMKIEEKED